MENGQDISDIAIGDVILDSGEGDNTNGNTPKYYTKGTAIRLYFGNTITFTCANGISEIAFNITQGSSSDLSASVGELDETTWTGTATSVTFTNTHSSDQMRISSVTITYKKEGLVVNNVALRFGVTMPKTDWDTIHANWSITDYGVMIAKETTVTNTYEVNSIKDAYFNGEYLLDLHIKTYAEPSSFNENEYIFTVKLNMTRQSNYNVVYYAAPYIVANGEYYFLTQIETSVNDLAGDFLTNGGSTLSNEALTLLSTLH